jgi:hypothetical protein
MGLPGALGPTGPTGPTGLTGPSGTGEFAEFFALMPPDNVAIVAAGAAVSFPQPGPQSGSITSVGGTQFQLGVAGTYRVSFVVSVEEAGQLELTLNGAPLPDTVVGRATGTSEIVGDSLVNASALDTLQVIDPAGNSPALTITPSAGGTHPVSASLVIQKLG